ncbi:MAG: hypothetical protein PUB18_04765 [bacterium]|nr:hypothetical protein [bacterium]
MTKKILFFFLFLFLIIPGFVSASDSSIARVGNYYYDTLEDAIANASSTDTIVLVSNVILSDTLLINKIVNLNLNGKDIVAPEKVFQVQGGTLNITGKGTIKESVPNYGAIMIKGSTTATDREYSVVNIGKDVTLEGWSGIFINQESSKAYGVVVNLAGSINALDDSSGGSGVGVYVNGKIQHLDNTPIVNILDDVRIVSSGTGLYIAGYSIFNIGKAFISGVESGIGIKAGILNINGATVECIGDNSTPTTGNNNGINSSGSAIQIESNSGYAGNMEFNISSGNFTSKESNVLYEYIGKGSSTLVKSIHISGGTFISKSLKGVFFFSNSFQDKHKSFVLGGRYSSDPSLYLGTGYSTMLENDLFTVVKNTTKYVDSDHIYINSRNHSGNLILIFVVVTAIITVGYCNRNKILCLLKR